MSRIGKLPVDLPAGVTVTVGPGNVVSVKGPLGQLSQKVDSDITVTVEGNQLTVTRPTDQPRHRSMHGLYRALIHNMVVGVSKGYEIKQELVGVGFKAEAKGQILELLLGLFPRYFRTASSRDQGRGRNREERKPDRHPQEHRQAADRSGRCQDPLAAQARALQGQRYQVRGRTASPQGWQVC